MSIQLVSPSVEFEIRIKVTKGDKKEVIRYLMDMLKSQTEGIENVTIKENQDAINYRG